MALRRDAEEYQNLHAWGETITDGMMDLQDTLEALEDYQEAVRGYCDAASLTAIQASFESKQLAREVTRHRGEGGA